jgi:mannobiose 2-epimerase
MHISEERISMINDFRASVLKELADNILPWWEKARDLRNGGFYGRVENDGRVDPGHDKGVVMHSRFLWTYSAADLFSGNHSYARLAEHAYAFLTGPLLDSVHGGFYWQVGFDGEPKTDRKVIYGQAFGIYALSEYYRASGDADALELAVSVFRLLEKTARDPRYGGYAEACAADWSGTLTSALSPSDLACDKSMNTNLHVMESYACLSAALSEAARREAVLRFDPETEGAAVRRALKDLVLVHADKILQPDAHFGIYFDGDWRSLVPTHSYGHDIEGSWLLTEAAGIAWDGVCPGRIKEAALDMAGAVREVVKRSGPGLANEYKDGRLDTTHIWWVQAECLVGFLNAAELSGDADYLDAAFGVWEYIRDKISDRANGEWFWGRTPAGDVIPRQPKGGLWKTNYHNGRACMEAARRLSALLGRGEQP